MKNSTRQLHEQSIRDRMENQRLRAEIKVKDNQINLCDNKIDELIAMNLKILKDKRVILGM